MFKANLLDRQDLTAREAEVLVRVCHGDVDKIIARQLAISIKTVEAHIGRIYQKLQVQNASINARCAAIGVAVSRGMVSFSVKGVLVFLMFQAAGLDNDQAARVGRLRLSRPQVMRVKGREA